jgi:hypothetical protein
MRHAPLHIVAQQAIRGQVCPQCTQRPAGSETLGPNVPRACEPHCAVFVHLKLLLHIAAATDQPTLAPYERAIQDAVCQRCTLSPTAGDFCAERVLQHCPLSRQMGQVIQTLQQVVAASRKSKARQRRRTRNTQDAA